MLVTSDETLLERMRFLGDHGRDPKDPTKNTTVGFKYKMSNLQAALGLAQLERLDELVEKKRLIFRWYQRAFERPSRGAAQCPASVGTQHLLDELDRVGGRQRSGSRQRDGGLEAIGDRFAAIFRPLSSMPMYQSRKEQNPVAYQVAGRGINLPSGHNLVERDVDYICAILRETLSSRKRAAA